MGSIKSDQQQTVLPMIIAMKGPSDNQKSEIACKLAEFLRCPLIDENDIILNLQNFPSNSSSESTYTKFFNELPFKIVTQISKTQLQLKLRVIINTPLFKYSHFDQLLQLANSKEACLIIIECTTQSSYDHDYDVGNVPKFSIDITKPFVADDLIPAIVNVAESYMHKGEGNYQSKGYSEMIDKITLQRFFTETHAHEFSFMEEPNIGSKKLYCNFCEKSISGPIYQCVKCDEFILHKSCAHSQKELKTILSHWQFYQESHPSKYNFPKEYKCKLCEQFSSQCNDCLLQSHIKGGILPTICSYKEHIHPLSFVIMPFWFDYEYKCIVCERYGKFISYKCYCCNLDLHTFCAIKGLKYKMLGPWGNLNKAEWDDGIFSTVTQLKLSVVHFSSTSPFITSIQVEYDDNGFSSSAYVRGEKLGQMHEIKLDYPDEFLISIQGYYEDELIRSLTFTSNRRTYGPYGTARGKFFSSPMTTSKIVGFHGYQLERYDPDDDFVSRPVAIGVYVEPIQ